MEDKIQKDAVNFLIEKGLLEEGFEQLIIKRPNDEIVLNDLLTEFALRNQPIVLMNQSN